MDGNYEIRQHYYSIMLYQELKKQRNIIVVQMVYHSCLYLKDLVLSGSVRPWNSSRKGNTSDLLEIFSDNLTPRIDFLKLRHCYNNNCCNFLLTSLQCGSLTYLVKVLLDFQTITDFFTLKLIMSSLPDSV